MSTWSCAPREQSLYQSSYLKCQVLLLFRHETPGLLTRIYRFPTEIYFHRKIDKSFVLLMLNEGILKKPGPSLKHLCSDTFQSVEVREYPLTTQSWTKGCHILKKLASLHAAHIFICILKKKKWSFSPSNVQVQVNQRSIAYFFFFSAFITNASHPNLTHRRHHSWSDGECLLQSLRSSVDWSLSS